MFYPVIEQVARKQKSRKSKKKNTEVPQPSGSTDNVPDENVPTTSNDPLLREDASKQGRKIADLDADVEDKGKAKMIESEKPLKKKDQIMYDQEVALNLQAQLQAELEEEERLTRQKEEEANIALIES
ncbi:hypothetical protein Tco_0733847 [Tanacetum coccineum]